MEQVPDFILHYKTNTGGVDRMKKVIESIDSEKEVVVVIALALVVVLIVIDPTESKNKRDPPVLSIPALSK